MELMVGAFRMKCFCVVMFALVLAGCARYERAKVEAQFVRDLQGIHHDRPLYLLESIPYAGESEEPRYRFVGTFPQEERERWALVWADYGKIAKHKWIPLEYPSTPFAFAPTFQGAEKKAEAHRLSFLESLDRE